MARPLCTPFDPARLKGIVFVTWVGFWANLFLCVFKIVAGILGNSRAVAADGIHSLSDLATDVIILIGVHFWSAPPDDDHPHGHRRLESLISLLVGLLLGGAGAGIAYDAALHLTAPHEPAGSLLALSAAVISVISKEWLFRWTLKRGRDLKSEAVTANAWGHRADAVSSLPIIPAVAASWWFPQLAFLDLVGAVLVAAFILHSAWKICAPALNTLLDKGASPQVLTGLKNIALESPGVLGVHDLRTRFLGGALQVDLHVGVDPGMTVAQADVIAHTLENTLYTPETAGRLGVEVCDALIHIDPWRPQTDNPEVGR